MVIGVNGAIGQTVTSLVVLDFKTDHEFVMIRHRLMVGMIVRESQVKDKFVAPIIVQVSLLIHSSCL